MAFVVVDAFLTPWWKERVNKNTKGAKPRNSARLKLWPRQSLGVFGAASCEALFIIVLSCRAPASSLMFLSERRGICACERQPEPSHVRRWIRHRSSLFRGLRSSCWAGPCPITASVRSPSPLPPPPPPHFFVLPVKSPAVCHFISVPARFTFALFTPLIVSRSNLVFPFHLPATHYLLVTYRNLAWF